MRWTRPSKPQKAPQRSLLRALLSDASPVDFQLLGRVLLHASLIGVLAGLVGAAFYWALEAGQRYVLGTLAGYLPLKAAGEHFDGHAGSFRPWLLIVLPAVGGLITGLVTQLAPEARGGGGDAAIEAYHRHRGVMRLRSVWVKAIASVATLSTGGVGGREGPTMQIGSALGSLVGRALNVNARERRILLLTGLAAGMSAVFRTPLGAALLASELLYRDGFESDTLVPAALASVVSYAVVVSIFGQSTMFAHAPHYPFVRGHLPLYGLMAVFIAGLGWAFIRSLELVRRLADRLPGPIWLKPAMGGLAVGIVFTPVVVLAGWHLGMPGQGFGIFGGGYGAAQVAITGAKWLPGGWLGVFLLLALAVAELIAASFTIGSGGSAGDFAPSLIIGGLFGGAFGRAAGLVTGDPTIDAGAFALVGMGAFYGGVAHVPLSSLVLVSELAGSYDLLVPLMLAEAVSFIALRKHTLYPAQLPTPRDSLFHAEAKQLDRLAHTSVREVMRTERPFVSFTPGTTTAKMLVHDATTTPQEVFPVFAADGKLVGIVCEDALHLLALEREASAYTVAADLMRPPAFVTPGDSLRTASELLLANDLRALPVLEEDGQLAGFVDEADVAGVFVRREAEATATRLSALRPDAVEEP